MKSIDIFTLDQEKAEEYLNLLQPRLPPIYAFCNAGVAVCAYAVAAVWLWVVVLQDAAVAVNYAVLINIWCQVAGPKC